MWDILIWSWSCGNWRCCWVDLTVNFEFCAGNFWVFAKCEMKVVLVCDVWTHNFVIVSVLDPNFAHWGFELEIGLLNAGVSFVTDFEFLHRKVLWFSGCDIEVVYEVCLISFAAVVIWTWIWRIQYLNWAWFKFRIPRFQWFFCCKIEVVCEVWCFYIILQLLIASFQESECKFCRLSSQ